MPLMCCIIKPKMAKKFKRTDSGILVPEEKPEAVQCGTCPRLIWKTKEVGGRIFVHNDLPICVFCRIMKSSKLAGAMVGSKSKRKFAHDLIDREKFIQDRADKELEEVALASQDREETRIAKMDTADRKRFIA